MKNILVKDVKYRGQRFITTPKQVDWNNHKFFNIESFDFFYVDTKTNNKPYQLKHWITTGFTQNTTRKIKMRFTGFASNETLRWDLIRIINRIFEPPHNPSDTNKGFYDMEFTDPTGTVWEFKAQTTSRPKISDYDNSKWVNVEVELLVEGWSCIFWQEEQTLTDRNYVVWLSLPTPLWESFWYYPATQINYQWISDAQPTVKITALQDNATDWYIIIRSIWSDDSSTNLYLSDINMDTGDVLEINPTNYSVELNGVDITGSTELSLGNNFPVLRYLEFEAPDIWNNQLVVDCWKVVETLSVEWKRRDTRC